MVMITEHGTVGILAAVASPWRLKAESWAMIARKPTSDTDRLQEALWLVVKDRSQAGALPG